LVPANKRKLSKLVYIRNGLLHVSAKYVAIFGSVKYKVQIQ